jgi:hypothetical protein
MAEVALDLREAKGAFLRIEDWLREKCFFASGNEALVADLYLGYGFSSTLRRDTTPPPPEPCPALPLAACRLRPAERLVTDCHEALRIGDWEQTWTAGEYQAAVDDVRRAIARGDVYQVNVVQHLSAPFSGSPRALAARLASLRPRSPAAFVTGEWAVVSASPELFLSRRGDRVGRCRSRARDRWAPPPSFARPRRMRRST